MGIGNLGGFDDLLLRGILHTEGNVIVEGVVEKNGFLIDIADKRTQIVYPDVADILTVDEYLATAYIVVARNQVH